jgi:stress 70 chaperone-associated protein
MSSGTGTTVAGVAVLSFLVGSHYVQKWLPNPKPKIIGIDLGTTYSCVGVYRAGLGVVDILPNEQGRRTIPSVVAFTEDGQTLVGAPAKEQSSLNPTNTIYESKRFIGKPFSAVANDDLERFPFTIVEQSGRPSFEITHEDRTTYFTPEDIGAAVIGALKQTAEHNLDGKIKQAVMSVPAEFTEAQRNATIKAGALAGLEVLRILSEPTAAAMAYGLHTKDMVTYIVVFDFGGGTLDVSLLWKQGGMFITHAIAGNKHLGGEDLSHAFFEFALEKLEVLHGGPITNPAGRQRLRTQVENAKHALSTDTIATVEVRPDDLEGTRTFSFEVTRDDFERVNKAMFAKVLAPLEKVLEESEIRRDQIDEIVLVGGSTRIPKVRELLKEFTGKEPCSSIDPDEAVAVGVAMQAGILAGAWPLQVSALEIPFNHRKIELD